MNGDERRMQDFKIENFIKANPDLKPPHFVPLQEWAVQQLSARLRNAAAMPESNPDEFIRNLYRQARPIEGIDVDKEETELSEVFRRAQIEPGPSVYVEWGGLRDIDRFETSELVRYFHDVWYPSSDDIEIFDDTLTWLLFIRHYGGVEIWRQASGFTDDRR